MYSWVGRATTAVAAAVGGSLLAPQIGFAINCYITARRFLWALNVNVPAVR
jgi:hypothetical protein